MTTLYTTAATATGGRNGQVKSQNGLLDIEVRYPKALGGANDDFLNPEMLFAAGYSACFDSALNLVIKNAKITTGTTTVTANISLGKNENQGFQLAAKLDVHVPGVDLETVKDLAEKAHQICPYSNATRGNMEVEITVSN